MNKDLRVLLETSWCRYQILHVFQVEIFIPVLMALSPFFCYYLNHLQSRPHMISNGEHPETNLKTFSKDYDTCGHLALEN